MWNGGETAITCSLPISSRYWTLPDQPGPGGIDPVENATADFQSWLVEEVARGMSIGGSSLPLLTAYS